MRVKGSALAGFNYTPRLSRGVGGERVGESFGGLIAEDEKRKEKK